MGRVEGKVAIVTGAGRGLGYADAVLLAREGARVIATDIDPAGSAALAAAGIEFRQHDVRDEASWKELVARVVRDHGRLDVLVNNAGVALGEITGMIDTLGMDAWRRYLTINSLAPLFLAKALRPALAAAQGVVINQSSMASFVPATVYGVTKATLNAMTYGMANVFAGDGIRVVAIAPGLMETAHNRVELGPETLARIRGMQLLPQLQGGPDDIARLALFLASEDGRFINCEVVSCDAGNRVRGWRY